MPSPFPGMDPFLEGSLWTTVHHVLTAEFIRQLSPRLRPRYLALASERFVTEEPDDVAVTQADVYPDVGVAQVRPSPPTGGVALTTAPLQLTTVVPEAVRHVTVEIRDVAKRKLVAAIEILSPTNKRGEGRKEYLRRRRRLLRSSAHLLEIDLLHKGRRVPMQSPLPQALYFAFVGRAERRPVVDVWPIQLADPLPAIPVPLLAGDADVSLDLQGALTAVYDAVGYDLAVDYGKPPEVALPPAEEAWADARLRAAGLRS